MQVADDGCHELMIASFHLLLQPTAGLANLQVLCVETGRPIQIYRLQRLFNASAYLARRNKSLPSPAKDSEPDHLRFRFRRKKN